MDRRKFIATSGTGIGLGIAGCLEGTVGDDSDADGDETDTIETGDEDEQHEQSGGSGDGNGSDDQSNETDDGGNSDGQSTETDDEDAQSDETTDEAETGVEDETDDEDETDEQSSDADERSVEFTSCARVELTGTFEDGDVAFASTGFYTEAGYGNTLLEDGVRFGTDVEAPFTGSVVFETASESAVHEGEDEIVVDVPNYGDDAVITGLTTEQADYMAAGITHENPLAEECLAERAPDSEDSGHESGDSEDDDAATAFDVSITGTNSPVDAGDSLEVSAELENTGGSGTEDVRLIVGNDPVVVETQSVTLEAGDRTTVTMGYETPSVDNDQEFPVRVETATDSAEQTVLVYGT